MRYTRLLGVRALGAWLSLSVEVGEGLGVGEDKLPFLTVKKRHSRKVLFKVLEDVSSQSIEFLLASSMEGPLVYMDEFRSYNVLDKLGYEHLKVNHSKGFYA